MRVILLDNEPEVCAHWLTDNDLKIQMYDLARLVSAVMKDNDPDYDFAGYDQIYLQNAKIVPKELRRWMAHSRANWSWCRKFFNAMIEEHLQRFDVNHTSHAMTELFDSVDLEGGEYNDKFTAPPIFLEDKFKVDNNKRTEERFVELKGKGKWTASALLSYRNWYMHRLQKDPMNWRHGDFPDFLRVNEERAMPHAPVRARGRF